MQGDLISKSALIKELREAENDDIIKCVIGVVQTQPTAYDVEAVVAGLEEVTIEHKESVEFFNECGIKFVTKEKAIEIVRNGGKE